MTVFIYLLGFGIIIPILPMLSRQFGATAFQTGLLMSSYSLMQFIFSPFWGKLSDKWGRRPILLFCMLCEAFAYLIFASAQNLETLFIARLLAGFFGASLSTASAYISDITTTQERSKGMALIGAAFGLGFMFGPAIGGALTIWAQHISTAPHFETSFSAYWVAAICFVNFLFGIKFLKESLDENNKTSLKLNRLNTFLKYFNTPTVGTLLAIFFLASIAMSSMEATFILFMSDKFAWSVRDVSFGFAYLGVMMVITQGYLVRKMIPRYGERNVLRFGLLSFALGVTGIAIVPTDMWMIVPVTLLALGTGLSNPSTLGSISLLTSENEQGAAMGVTQSMASLGRILGPAMGGWIYAALAHEAPFYASGLMALSAFILVIFIFHKIPISGKVIH